MVDPSCLQLSNRVPYWLNRIPRELWKSIRLWLYCYCLPRLHVCHLCVAVWVCMCVALACIRNVISPPLIRACICWACLVISLRWVRRFLSNESVSASLCAGRFPAASSLWVYFERTRTGSSCQPKIVKQQNVFFFVCTAKKEATRHFCNFCFVFNWLQISFFKYFWLLSIIKKHQITNYLYLFKYKS